MYEIPSVKISHFFDLNDKSIGDWVMWISSRHRRHVFRIKSRWSAKVNGSWIKDNLGDFDATEFFVSSMAPAPNGRPVRDRAPIEGDQSMIRKYGSQGEGPEHKKYKEWVVTHPESIGLTQVKKKDTEYGFISGDTADIVFEIRGNCYIVVEIETDYPLPGAYQALKYRVLKCAEMGENINSQNVEAVLVAKTMPPEVRNMCYRYGIRYVLINL